MLLLGVFTACHITELKLHIFNKTAQRMFYGNNGLLYEFVISVIKYFDLSGITFSGPETDIPVRLLIAQKMYCHDI